MTVSPLATSLMIMGTGSDAGKSLIVAGLCRAFANRGLKVAPFKPQNMSNNAAVTADGGEIGRAQALQARAARKKPTTAMNPILLKPEHDHGAQLVVRGARTTSLSARDYFATRARYLPVVLDAFNELVRDNDLVLVEGAGSASEVNLRHNDLANFGFAHAANVPVVLSGDIQRGGVIAALVGTFAVIAPDDAAMIVATLINKFQGDPALFSDGQALIATRTNRPCLGPIPFFADAARLPAEDVLALDHMTKTQSGEFLIAVPRLGRIANFDDLDPLRAEPGVNVEIVNPGQPIPRNANLIILPGSKATIADMGLLRAEGWDIDIIAHARAGGAILGVCGGYQMLGRTIADPEGLEGVPGTVDGLGLLDVDTVLAPAKQLRLEGATECASGEPLSGYHMHLGRTFGPDCARPFAMIANQNEGAMSRNSQIIGTYLHGLFATDGFRRAFLNQRGAATHKTMNYDADIDGVLDRLAAHFETHLDLDQILGLARAPEF